MVQTGFVLITDRGGHLHNAVMLLKQMNIQPEALVTTYGPDIDAVKQFPQLSGAKVFTIPYLFSWWGKTRYFNVFKAFGQLFLSLYYALRLRPKAVVSLGATNVVFFCFWARLLGGRIYHVECMNQVYTRSITGRMLYPICTKLYVQWKDLLLLYGKKAEYAGWVL